MTAQAASPPPALELRAIDKHFGAVQANRAVSLAVARGTIHGLIGENGAGKSTLMAIAGGELRPDRGRILVNGVEQRFRGPREAQAAGIGMVHQHFQLVEGFTALENIVLGREGGWRLKPGSASDTKPAARTEEVLKALDHAKKSCKLVHQLFKDLLALCTLYVRKIERKES